MAKPFLGYTINTLVLLLFASSHGPQHFVEATCEAYGICYDDFFFKKSCYTPNAEPITIDENAVEILKQRCPHFFAETGRYHHQHLLLIICRLKTSLRGKPRNFWNVSKTISILIKCSIVAHVMVLPGKENKGYNRVPLLRTPLVFTDIPFVPE